MNKIETLKREVTALLPTGWTASEAFGLDMMGGSTAEFVMCSTEVPETLRYGGGVWNETPAKRKARQEGRAKWRELTKIVTADLAAKIRKNVDGVKVQADVTRVYVYPQS
jgi:hypothetical protein